MNNLDRYVLKRINALEIKRNDALRDNDELYNQYKGAVFELRLLIEEFKIGE